MSPFGPVQTLPSFNLAVHEDHYKTVLPNVSYPSRPITHIPWSGSTAPLLFSKTTRLVMSITASNPNFSVQVPGPIPTTASSCFDTSLVVNTFYRVGMLIWHKLSTIVRKFKLIKQKLLGI